MPRGRTGTAMPYIRAASPASRPASNALRTASETNIRRSAGGEGLPMWSPGMPSQASSATPGPPLMATQDMRASSPRSGQGARSHSRQEVQGRRTRACQCHAPETQGIPTSVPWDVDEMAAVLPLVLPVDRAGEASGAREEGRALRAACVRQIVHTGARS